MAPRKPVAARSEPSVMEVAVRFIQPMQAVQRDYTHDEILNNPAMFQAYQLWLKLPMTQIMLRAAELAIKPKAPRIDHYSGNVGFGRHMLHCGQEGMLRFIGKLDLLKPAPDMPASDYSADELLSSMERSLTQGEEHGT